MAQEIVPQKRIEWIDQLRGILFLFVIICHSRLAPPFLKHLYEPIFLTGFFFLSGYLYKDKDYVGYLRHLYNTFMPENTLLIPNIDKMNLQELIEYTYEISKRVYDLKKMLVGIDKLKELEKKVLLEVVDSYWIDHIDAMDQLRQVIGLSAIGQKDPVKEYTIQAYDMFEELNKNIRCENIKDLYKFN